MSFLQLRSPRIQNVLSVPGAPPSTDLNISVSDAVTITESITIAIQPAILTVQVMPDIQMINGPVVI